MNLSKRARLALTLGLIALALLGCGGKGVRKRISEPSVSVQELKLEGDGRATLALRINNFSTVPMHFSAAQLNLELADAAPIVLPNKIDLEVPGEAADVLRLTIALSEAQNQRLRAIPGNGNLAYSLDGKIRSDRPKGKFEIEYDSRLTAVPGAQGLFR